MINPYHATQKMKKFLGVILLISLLLSSVVLPITAHATERGETDRYILTEFLPLTVEDYAKSIFSTLNYGDLEVLNLNNSSDPLKLAHGFKVDLITSNHYNKYFFPILRKNQVVATLIVNDFNGELCYTILHDKVTEAINNLYSSTTQPVKFVVSDFAVYTLDDKALSMLSESPYATESTKQADRSKIATRSINEQNTTVIAINEEQTYDVKMSVTRAVTGRRCKNFPFVDNKVVNGKGTCWASSTAAIIEYIKKGAQSTNTSACSIRDQLLKKQTSGGINNAQDFIERYTGRKLRQAKGSLAWFNVKEQILDLDNPLYTRWQVPARNSFHAMVIFGYDYENTNDSNRRIYLMDPNSSSMAITSHTGAYSATYGESMAWVMTLYE